MSPNIHTIAAADKAFGDGAASLNSVTGAADENGMPKTGTFLDALTGLVLVWWLLPKYALTAYIGILYVTEGMNLVLSVLRLRSVTRFRPGPCGAGASSHRRGGAGERCVYTAGR